MNNTPVTFFDVVSALRDRRELRFTYPNGSEVVGVPARIELAARDTRNYLAIGIGGAPEFFWTEVNNGVGGYGIIHELG